MSDPRLRITIEGAQGVGKSRVAIALAQMLNARGWHSVGITDEVIGDPPIAPCPDADAVIIVWQHPPFDLRRHLKRQREFSERAFGPGARVAGVIDHIRKELIEVENSNGALDEWIDVVILALDGAWRCGHEPEAIIAALVAKQAKNESRTWPDWRTAEPGKAIEHDRSAEAAS